MESALKAMHTQARRYCFHKMNRYRTEQMKTTASHGIKLPSHISQHMPSMFPFNKGLRERSYFLFLALQEIEKIDPSNFQSIESLKSGLSGIADSVLEKEILEKPKPIPEANQYKKYIMRFPVAALKHTNPLFYRRVLSPEERKELLDRAIEYWDIRTGYWFPLDSIRPGIHAIAFEHPYPAPDHYARNLRGVFEELSIKRIFEIPQTTHDGTAYEIDAAWIDPFNKGREVFWFDADLEWAIYTTHENTIAFIGETLGASIRKHFPSMNMEWKNPI